MTKFSKLAAIVLLLMGVLLATMALLSAKRQGTPASESVIPQAAEPKISVVVAARSIPAGHVLVSDDVSVQNMAQLPPQGFGVASLVVGRSAAVEIAQGAPVLSGSLLEGLAGLLAAGERAVSIKVDEASAVGHKLKPGDWVDVFAVLRRDSQEVDASQALMLLPKKQVLAYGAHIQGEPPADDKKSQGGQSAAARTAVIAVQVEEVNRLLLAEQQGQVLLALRSPLDQYEPSADKLKQFAGLNVATDSHPTVSKEVAALDASLTALTMAQLAQQAVAKTKVSASPAKTPTARAVRASGMPVEVIRGTRKETVRY